MGFELRRPRDASLRLALAEQAKREFSYPEVGATRDPARLVRDRFERRYDLDHHRVRLGAGREIFARAQAALVAWAPFAQGWVEMLWPDAPVAEGSVVGVLAQAPPLWSLNACRVVYVHEEQAPVERFAFAYGTLPDHVARGEERFCVERHPGSDEVFFDLMAFSQPRSVLAKLGRPYARRLQRRFGRGALAAMQRAVA